MGTQVDVVDARPQDVDVYAPQLLALCREQDPAEVLRRFGRRFEQAETLDDLFGAIEGTNSQQMVGRKVEVHGVQWAPYESERGTIPLAIVQAFDLDGGEQVEFATTSGMLCLFLFRWQQLGLKPFQAKIVGKRTTSGQTALNFERI